MLLGVVVVLAAVWAFCAVLGGYVAEQKNRPRNEGVLLGVALGFLGVLVEALLPTLTPPDPEDDTPEPDDRAAADFLRTLAAPPERPPPGPPRVGR